MFIAGHNQIVMDFVGHHEHLVLAADGQQLLQLFLFPHPAHWIVGRGKDEELDLVVHDLLFKVGVVDVVNLVFPHKIAGDQLAAVVPDGVQEGIVDRREHDDAIAWLGLHVHIPVDGGDHTRGKPKPLFFNVAVMVFFFPIDEVLIIGVGHFVVAVNAEIGILPGGFPHAFGDHEIHVGHPQGHQVIVAKTGVHAVPFVAVGADPIHIFDLFHSHRSFVS